MAEILVFLNKYSNLMLAIITAVYAVLTGKMALEMRKAREAQADANIVAGPVGWESVYARVRLENAGPGPALNVEMSISFDPLLESTVKTFRYHALAVNEIEYFMLTGRETGSIESLHELGETYKELVIKVRWDNIFGRHKYFSGRYNLKELAEGWYKAHHLIPPDEVPLQLREIGKTFEKMHGELRNIAQYLSRLPNGKW